MGELCELNPPNAAVDTLKQEKNKFGKILFKAKKNDVRSRILIFELVFALFLKQISIYPLPPLLHRIPRAE